ncbi:MAG: restriction endonuclease, partial [Nanoarchaeota archaeon]|nr:restriction endonuclease [Nanoarchaeota archaeon]
HNSLERAGADKETINEITGKVDGMIYDGIDTKKLFKFVFSELKKSKSPAGMRYNLKQGIIDLSINGAGFTFEKFMARIMEKQGYKTELNRTVKGQNITHEIDVTATKGKEILMVEAKYHDKPWLGTPIQTALYVYARFLDLKKEFTKPMLATNTKFSEQVIDYSRGVGIRLMGWNYPQGDSLVENIEKYKLYPITILSLPKNTIKDYLAKKILTLDELLKEKNLSPEMKKEIEGILNGK